MAKRKDIAAERAKKRSLWISRTIEVTGYDEATITQLLNTPRTQSVRFNPLKSNDAPVELKPIDWCENGYELPKGFIPDENAVANGEIYIQNAASWLPVLALDPQQHNAILDVCAAPGGKSSHIQAVTGNRSKLTCNDNSKPRLIKLQANMERLGAEASYTLCDATRLSRKFEPETFDRILLDAPCSGEGLMTLDNMKLFDSWSVAHIRRLSDLQKKILSESWQLLKPGGTLVYSTCTMAPEENEAVIDYFLRKNLGAKLEMLNFPLENRIPALSAWNDKLFANDMSNCLRLLPDKLTEAFFVAKLIKQ
jgi:16S rRNA (cytosine1407-C5)-methyltransferase